MGPAHTLLLMQVCMGIQQSIRRFFLGMILWQPRSEVIRCKLPPSGRLVVYDGAVGAAARTTDTGKTETAGLARFVSVIERTCAESTGQTECPGLPRLLEICPS